MKVLLPTIKVRSGLIKPRHIREGELAHVRFEFAEKITVPVGPGDVRHARIHTAVVPAAKAQEWRKSGVTQSPIVTLHSGKGQGLKRPDGNILESLVHVRIRFGSKDTTNIYVPPALAREWVATALKFERLHHDYQQMMRGG